MPKSQERLLFFHAVEGGGWILERGLVLELQLGGQPSGRAENEKHSCLKLLTTRK